MKQRLYDKFLKYKTTKTLETYKNYKNLFENKKSSQKHYYQNKLEKCKNNLKTTWGRNMEEITGKSKVFHQNLPNNLKINKTSITVKKLLQINLTNFLLT